MKTVICHFYNEEYLLPFWLIHHKRMFDKGIMINYGSTDRGIDIIKEICPDWEIIDSRNLYFGAREVDEEIELIEKKITGWRIVLNVTEFLIGDLDKNCSDSDLTCKYIQSIIMVCHEGMEGLYPNHDELLCEQFTHGICLSNPNLKQKYNSENPWSNCSENPFIRSHVQRRLSSYSYPYELGRHFTNKKNSDLLILWFRNSPFNDEMIKRNLQIQEKISQEDKNNGFGFHHLIDKDGLINELNLLRQYSSNIFDTYKHLIPK